MHATMRRRSFVLLLLAITLFALTGPLDLGRTGGWLLPLAVLTAPLVLVQWVQARRDAEEPALPGPTVLRGVGYATLFFGIVLLGEDFGEPFIYFRF